MPERRDDEPKAPSEEPKAPSPNPKGPNKKNDSEKTRTTIIMVVLLALVAFFIGSQLLSVNSQTKTDTLDTGTFVKAVEQGRVESVTYAANDYTVNGTYYPAATAGAEIASAFNVAFDAIDSKVTQLRTPTGGKLDIITTQGIEPQSLGEIRNYSSVYVGADALGELLADHPNIKYQITLPSGWTSLLISLLPFVLIAALLFFFFSQMQKANNSQLSFGKNRAKKTLEERPDVKFSDVAGVDEAVEEMQEVKDFLANPEKYQSIGAKIPRGCLLVGPPGTGKTLLARAVAGEAGVPFFSISGSDFVEMFVGVGASRVRDLFKDAKEAAPAIIFIDEIDAVGRQRGTGLGGGHDEREQTLNQLLVEMDGFEASESVVLIAATNRADVLDPALLRPGRFDRQIVVDTPDVKGREKILEVHSADKPISNDVDLAAIAKITPGFTGADLANLMTEAALLTARRSKTIITMREVTESLERVIAGPERKGRVLNEKVKHTIAYHESGHALVGHLLAGADPVHKISIISRGRALGYTLSIPDDDKPLNTLSEMKDELAVFMGGRVAEEIFCDDITTGASNDLERASKMARAIVTQYGMSPLGTQVFGQPNHEVFLGRDYGNTQDYSDETARRIDVEVSKIMKEAHDRAHAILAEHAEQMDLMASVLLERETVEGEACQALLDNKWPEYLAREGEIIAMHEREEAEARKRDLAAHPELTEGDVKGSAPAGAPGGGNLPAPNAADRVENPSASPSPAAVDDKQDVHAFQEAIVKGGNEAQPQQKETIANGANAAEPVTEGAPETQANPAQDASASGEADSSAQPAEADPRVSQGDAGQPAAEGNYGSGDVAEVSSGFPSGSHSSPAGEADAGPVANERLSNRGTAADSEEVDLIAGISFDGMRLANPDWRDARVEPGDQDPNGPYRVPAIQVNLEAEPTQAQVEGEIRREDEMLASPEAPDPTQAPVTPDPGNDPADDSSDDPYADPYGTRGR